MVLYLILFFASGSRRSERSKREAVRYLETEDVAGSNPASRTIPHFRTSPDIQ